MGDMMRIRTFLAATSICLLAAGPVSALVVVNADFNSTTTSPPYANPPSGTYSGTAAAPDPGTIWNGLGIGAQGTLNATYTSGTLSASDGSSTPVTVTLNDYATYDVQGANGAGAGVAQALLNDFAYDFNNLTAPASTFSISGIPTAVTYTYDLYIYSGGGSFGNSTSFTIGATTLTLSGGPFATFDDATSDGVGNYIKFSSPPVTLGTISGSWTGSNSRFSGFQLAFDVPEPTSLAALAFVSTVFIGRRRGR